MANINKSSYYVNSKSGNVIKRTSSQGAPKGSGWSQTNVKNYERRLSNQQRNVQRQSNPIQKVQTSVISTKPLSKLNSKKPYKTERYDINFNGKNISIEYDPKTGKGYDNTGKKYTLSFIDDARLINAKTGIMIKSVDRIKSGYEISNDKNIKIKKQSENTNRVYNDIKPIKEENIKRMGNSKIGNFWKKIWG